LPSYIILSDPVLIRTLKRKLKAVWVKIRKIRRTRSRRIIKGGKYME
jgi:hypothetical protein